MRVGGWGRQERTEVLDVVSVGGVGGRVGKVLARAVEDVEHRRACAELVLQLLWGREAVLSTMCVCLKPV